MAAASALATAACSPRPQNEIVPYVNMPERVVPGTDLLFATALTLGGYAQPILGQTWEGRPTKVEPNPDHPFGGGGSDPFRQASVLTLYDPDRSRSLLHDGDIASWNSFIRVVSQKVATFESNDGEGLRILTGALTSPSLIDQIGALLRKYPRARWHQWESLGETNAAAGAALAFGRSLRAVPHFDKALRIVSLDADFLGPGPHQVAFASGFSEGRRARRDSRELTRLHVAEPTLTITGANADHRLALRRADIASLARALAQEFGAPAATTAIVPSARDWARDWARRAAADLRDAPGRALVVVGEGQPAEVHALAHWINGRIGAFGGPVTFIEQNAPTGAPIAGLAADMKAGHVDTLLMLDCNPAYDAPAELDFANALRNIPFSVHYGIYVDETAAHSHWHVPGLHPFETWTDARTLDGTATIAQPLITPLYDGKSGFEILGALFGGYGNIANADRLAVQAHWRSFGPPEAIASQGAFDLWWRKALRDGFVAGSAFPTITPPEPRFPPTAPAMPAAAGRVELCFLPDPSVYDGRFSNNAWLQELPKPVSKQVWGNAALISKADAQRLGVGDGDIVRLSRGSVFLDAQAMIAPGQAEGSIGLHLGYGRSNAGEIGSRIGANASLLRTSDALWSAADIAVKKTGAKQPLLTTQSHHSMEGRDIVRSHTLEDFQELARATPEHEREAPATLYPDDPLHPKRPDGSTKPDYAWAMVIDESTCIGCNACVIACQAENNVPVVGPEEIERGREMHWLRVDAYYDGAPDNPDVMFQPVPCMHCEKAPCEPVCPVEASVHDHEGLNVQVYNRCIGTRFCQANCPYKVRRFNFFGYGNGQEYANLGEPMLEAVHNPDVTVRARGVMEKCTYCVQRISRARRTAEKEGREVAEGEVVTACQSACPTQAIQFGDMARHDSAVSSLKREPHGYDLLAELGTRPRTSYLGRVRSSGPALGPGDTREAG
nr:4Fe-4S dicluster domain-containing protein [Faunimonas pinastri]